ncbi:MAG: putative DNA binding domain-containing protein [Victivallales bacterium]|nr:putative DNA binding domain-containing protein [Victivallales bacterium]
MKKLTADDIIKLLAAPETDRMEFKEAKNALPQSFWESYSAFANADGGLILLGVKETDGQYHIQGVDDAEKLMHELWNSVNNRQKISANILFNRCIYAVDCVGKTVVVVDVPRPSCHDRPVFVGPNPYTGSFRRNGEGDYRCSEEAVDAMLRNRSHEGGDHQIVENLTIADLNQDTLRRYRNRLQMRREGAPWNEIEIEELLLMTGAARRDEQGIVRPTLAALLMFGNFGYIVGEFPHYFVDYIERLDDNPRYSDRISPLTADWSGNLYDFYSRVASHLTADVKTPFALDKEMYRIDDTPIHKAIRECLANTLVHADFYGRRGIVIEKRFRHITFSNPGIFRVPLDVAIAGGTSDARNDVLFTLFALVEIGEKLGTGLFQLFALWKEHGWPEPQLQEQFDPERTVLTLDYNDPEDTTTNNDQENTHKKTESHEQENQLNEQENKLNEQENKLNEQENKLNE